MVAQYADEAKRLRTERGWLLMNTVLWVLMAVGGAVVAVLGFIGIRTGAVAGDLAFVLLVAGVIGLFVAGTLAVGAIIEWAQWSRTHHDGSSES